jgi:hypothetical protein
MRIKMKAILATLLIIAAVSLVPAAAQTRCLWMLLHERRRGVVCRSCEVIHQRRR